MNRNTLITLTIAVLLVGGVVTYVLTHRANTNTETQNTTATTSSLGSAKVTLDGVPEGATVEVIGRVKAELFDKTPRPSTSRPLPEGGVPADAYAILLNKRAGLVSEIEQNPAAMQNWLALGTVHKQVNDYEGARVYYKYVTTVNPENLAARWNLGSLYLNYLKDYANAESEFRAVIQLDRTYVDAYITLHQLYVETKATAKAESVLKEGIAANPDNADLLILLARLYAKNGDVTNARLTYDKAIAAANKANNKELAVSLQAEKDALR